MAMNIPFVGFQPVTTSEHMAGFGVFGLIQLVGFISFLEPKIGAKNIRRVTFWTILAILALGIFIFTILTSAGYIQPWNGRFYSLWDTGYAIIHLPLIASVSEHQPTRWSMYFNDLACLPLFGIAGIFYCFKKCSNSSIFLVIYVLFSAYFSGIMVRLLLTLSPVLCVLAAISISVTLTEIFKPNQDIIQTEKLVEIVETPSEPISDSTSDSTSGSKVTKMATVKSTPISEYLKNNIFLTKLIVLITMGGACLHYLFHSHQVIERNYSNPSIILTGQLGGKGGKETG